MLEKPPISDHLIASCLREDFRLHAPCLTFLPLGADVHTAVYSVTDTSGKEYFLKLRNGPFTDITLTLPRYLYEQGIQEIIPPLLSAKNLLYSSLEEYKLILYPYIHGQDGYSLTLTRLQWKAFGAALRSIHTIRLPTFLKNKIPHEIFSDTIHKDVKYYQALVEENSFQDAAAAKLASLMRTQRLQIDHMLQRASQLAGLLQVKPPEYVLCQGDMHPGNLHITPEGEIYIVDWDNPFFAPRERDLGLIGGDGTGIWSSLAEEDLFFSGYGQTQLDPLALAYYRYERILEDISAFCHQLLLTDEGGQDRLQSYIFCARCFLPGREVEIAFRTDPNELEGF